MSGTNMVVTEKSARHLLSVMGWKTADDAEKWTIEKMALKLNQMEEWIDKANLLPAGKDSELRDSILEGLKEGKEVKVKEGKEGKVGSNGEANGHANGDSNGAPPSYCPEKTTTHVLNVSDLVYAGYNPEDRTDEEKAGIKTFAKQLLTDGRIFQPILVRPDLKTIIDGHRRTAAAKINGWPQIEARVDDGDADAVYASINSAAKKLTGTDTLEVWLHNPKAVPSKVSKKMAGIREVIGKPLMAKLLKAGLSARTFATAHRLACYCEMTEEDGTISSETAKTIVEWMITHEGCVGKVMRAMAEKQDGKAIAKKIKANKPLVFKIEAD